MKQKPEDSWRADVSSRTSRSLDKARSRAERIREDARDLADDVEFGKDQNAKDEEQPERPKGEKPLENPSLIRLFTLAVGVLMIVFAIALVVRRSTRFNNVTFQPTQGVQTSETVAASCDIAAREVVEPPAEPLPNPRFREISRADAERIADQTFAAYLQLEGQAIPAAAGGMQTLRVTLPNGEQRVVWSRVWVPEFEEAVEGLADPEEDGEQDTDANNGMVVYLDARTGQPLVIYDQVTVEDPLAEGCDESFVGEAIESVGKFFRRIGPTIAMVVVLFGGAVTLFAFEYDRHGGFGGGGGGGDSGGTSLMDLIEVAIPGSQDEPPGSRPSP